MDNIQLSVTLLDNITQPSKKAEDALKSLEATAKKAGNSLDFGKDLSRSQDALNKLTKDPKGYQALLKSQEAVKQQRKKLMDELSSPNKLKGAGGFADSISNTLSSKLSLSKIASAAAFGTVLAEGALAVGSALVDAAHKVVDIITGGIGKAFSLAGKQQTLQVGENLSLREEAKPFRDDINRFAGLTGFGRGAIRSMLLPLRRAGFSQQGARSAFAAAGDVAAGEGQGGNQGRVQEVLGAFERIRLKGGIQEKLLPSIGVDVKEFYATLAKAKNISAEQAKKLAAEGKLDPKLLLNAIYQGIERKQGGALGTGVIAYGKTFEARLEKFANLPDRYLASFVKSPAFTKASDLLGSLLEKLDPESPTGKRIMVSLEGMFDRLTAFFANPDELVDSIASGIENVIGLVNQLIPDLKLVADAIIAAVGATAELVRTARLYAAVISGDNIGAAKILMDEQQDKIDKIVAQGAKKKAAEDASDSGQIASAVGQGVVSGVSPMYSFASAAAAAASGSKATVVHMPVTNNISVTGTDEETAKKSASEHQRHMVNATERAVNEGTGARRR